MITTAQPCANSALPAPQKTGLTTRWAAAVRCFWTARRVPPASQFDDSQLTALDGLSYETLKDIGAPEWLQEQAYHTRQRAHQGGLLEQNTLHWR